jgi:CRP/FNR family transcriptional regulator, cyclic AMP receptor protein
MWGLHVPSIHLSAWPTLIGYGAAAANLCTFSMRTMIPLRVTGIVANLLYIIYGFFGGVYPALVLHVILLPLNIVRLRQMLLLVRKVHEASRGDLSMDWLKPFMTRRKCRKGEVVFRKDDIATEMFYTVSGRFRLVELGIDVPVGQVVGELGLLASENHRTQTLECIEDGDVLTINYSSVEQLYFQNPKFGFYFLRLATQRLFQNIVRLEDELARKSGGTITVNPTA